VILDVFLALVYFLQAAFAVNASALANQLSMAVAVA
jgi:hypothetical protein